MTEKDRQYEGKRILLVEDEETLAKGLLFNLKEEGYHVFWARDGLQALELFESETYDLIILDIMLPYHDGYEVAQKIRQKSPQIPILMLTARTSIYDRIKGLEVGADDYLTKPFHLRELLLRIEGMLKRKSWYKSEGGKIATCNFGENEINFETLSGRAGDREIQLTLQEARLLKYLNDHKNTAVSRKELLEQVWNIPFEIETRTVDNFVMRLRKYFEPDPARPVFFKSVRGVGYIFTG
ncbi:MAG: response regulator transcription factor [Candidatus Marinimicrobia bacterium]|nr:response regulator transcription factor [bacterium]MCG2716609.1 response regulator transcription factor [Candidatus Neomarinimicrobiota bacterium]